MSALGPSLAGSIVQAPLQAQQVARQRDRAAAQHAHDANRLHEMLQAHMRALEEDEGFESPANLHIDQHLPDRHAKDQPPEKRRPRPAPDQPAADGEAAPPSLQPQDAATLTSTLPAAAPAASAAYAATPPAAPAGEGPLYRHLDVQA